MKKYKIDRFTGVSEPIRTPITKFGGQPVWLTEPIAEFFVMKNKKEAISKVDARY
ncbi:hypothetical protein [Paenibacillus sp. GCM10027626]|uniref:hypothetical protein n=1 Tax=Paenibacillus sp. GCM10027626 TaxID=3273411 RepID=UPI0036429590